MMYLLTSHQHESFDELNWRNRPDSFQRREAFEEDKRQSHSGIEVSSRSSGADLQRGERIVSFELLFGKARLGYGNSPPAPGQYR